MSLCELAGLSFCAGTAAGMSMVTLMGDTHAEWKEQVISKYFDGISVRIERYSHTEWNRSDSTVYARMLCRFNVNGML